MIISEMNKMNSLILFGLILFNEKINFLYLLLIYHQNEEQ